MQEKPLTQKTQKKAKTQKSSFWFVNNQAVFFCVFGLFLCLL